VPAKNFSPVEFAVTHPIETNKCKGVNVGGFIFNRYTLEIAVAALLSKSLPAWGFRRNGIFNYKIALRKPRWDTRCIFVLITKGDV
jgi:hypothetical protein